MVTILSGQIVLIFTRRYGGLCLLFTNIQNTLLLLHFARVQGTKYRTDSLRSPLDPYLLL